jgi:hypothetical protein
VIIATSKARIPDLNKIGISLRKTGTKSPRSEFTASRTGVETKSELMKNESF